MADTMEGDGEDISPNLGDEELPRARIKTAHELAGDYNLQHSTDDELVARALGFRGGFNLPPPPPLLPPVVNRGLFPGGPR